MAQGLRRDVLRILSPFAAWALAGAKAAGEAHLLHGLTAREQRQQTCAVFDSADPWTTPTTTPGPGMGQPEW